MSDNNINDLDNIFDVTAKLYKDMSGGSREFTGEHMHIFKVLTELGKTLAASDRASFWYWDKRNHSLWTTAAVGTERITIPENSGLVGKALSQKQTIVTNDPYNCPDFNQEVDKVTGYTTKSILCMPIANCNGEYIGVFQAINKLGDVGFNLEEDERKLSMVALICGLALESEIFLEESHHDKLTGLKNRMGFYSDYARFRNPEKACLFICDIDHFKKVNDTYGHNAGDAVLASTAQVFKNNVRSIDSVYRWGGEEFIALLPDSDMTAALTVAERVRKAIEISPVTFEDQVIRYTLSVGVISLDPTLSIEDNISRADEHLYTAKETGRNRVIH